MSQPLHAVTSSQKSKRVYRKGSPLSVSERQQALTERRKNTHKEIKVYVPLALKQSLQTMCDAEGISQTEMITRLIEKASDNTTS